MTGLDGTQGSLVLGADERRTVRRCLAILAVLGTGSLVGVAFSLYLVNHAPLLLVALSPLGRHLVLVAPIVPPVAFLAVVGARRMAFYLAMFHLGRGLGPAGIPWLEERAASFARFVRWVEALFARASYLVVFALSGPTVAALAGISGMHAGLYAVLAAAGLLVRLLLVLGFAELLREPIEALLALIDDWWLPGTVVLVAGLALYQWLRLARIRRTLPGGAERSAD